MLRYLGTTACRMTSTKFVMVGDPRSNPILRLALFTAGHCRKRDYRSYHPRSHGSTKFGGMCSRTSDDSELLSLIPSTVLQASLLDEQAKNEALAKWDRQWQIYLEELVTIGGR